MANVKISELPVSNSNSFSTIFPQVKEGTTNQIALSGFNTNDFVNVVNLGTGSTASILTMDCSLGDVFVYTYTGTTGETYSASTINAVFGKTYYFVAQHRSLVNNTFILANSTNTGNIINLTSTSNRWTLTAFIAKDDLQIPLTNPTTYPYIVGNFPY